MERARKRGWVMVCLDLGVDTSTPSGEMMASVLATFAQFERRLIGERTRAALAIVRATGSKSGRPIGNPSFRPVPAQVVALILRLRDEGMSYRRLTDELNARQIPTAQGGKQWHTKTVFDIVKRATEQQAA